MRSWAFSLACFLPLAGLGACPPALRAHLPGICLAASASCVLLSILPPRLRFARLLAAAALACAFLGVARVPWRHPWDAASYWTALAVVPAFAAGLHRLLLRLRGGEAAGPAYLAVLAVHLFPIKPAFKLLGLGLPPTPVLSPLVLLALLGAVLWGWRRLPPAGREALSA